MCERYDIEAIAIGNGTASRETESFIRGIELGKDISVVMVNESGASVYSASKVAREEFPDQDQSMLKQSLDDVVMSCVNSVGVEVNTASKQLLTYVSGLGPQLAQNIVDYRNENGPFESRRQLKKVPRLGAKAFEQATGFLRIRDGANPLDASAVHPESYHVVDSMASDVGGSVAELMKGSSLRMKVQLQNYVTDFVGLPTLNDIMQELAKPGRDPREQFEVFSFADGVETLQGSELASR